MLISGVRRGPLARTGAGPQSKTLGDPALALDFELHR